MTGRVAPSCVDREWQPEHQARRIGRPEFHHKNSFPVSLSPVADFPPWPSAWAEARGRDRRAPMSGCAGEMIGHDAGVIRTEGHQDEQIDAGELAERLGIATVGART